MHSQETTAPQQNTVIAPSSHTDIFQQALSLHQQGQSAQAEQLYRELLTQQPHHVYALHFLGVLAHQRKDAQLAVDLIKQSLALNPNNASAHLDIGCAFQDLQDFTQALTSYNQALRINPNYAEAFYNRGNLLFDYQHFDKAVLSYDASLKINPDNVEAYRNRGIALKNLNRYDEAIASYAQALAINPDYPYLFGDWLFLKITVCHWDRLEQHLNTLATGIKQHKLLSIPFVVLAVSASAALQKKVAELYIQAKYPANLLLPPIAKHAHSKIRIGYFSADFHHHATAYLMAELFERHDKSRFEIIAFSFRAVSDDMHLRLQSAFDQFIDVSQQSDEQVVCLARQLECDIAVDLKGFTEKARTGLFAMRLATIQVSYLGYPSTMGAAYMDYLIADSVLIPNDYQPYYAEKIVYLPNSYQVNDSTRVISDRQFTRAELDLPEQGFVFCCFNNNYKITPEMFACWMRLLKQIDGSVLWLLEDNPSAANNLRLAATARGIAPNRLIFAKRMTLPEHLARHRLADLFLDTLPCNAHTTCSDALWVGLPVLTCVGEGFASRVAASLLTALGLPELITTCLEDYEALAYKLATHPEQLATLKQNTLNNRLSSPLFNTALFTQHFESALQAMFDRYQAGLAPDHIYVSAPADTAKLLLSEVPTVQNPIDLFPQAFSLHQQGQLAQAEQLYEQLLKAQPQHIDGLHFFGVLCNQRGQAQRAVELINQSLAIAQNNAGAHSNLGLALQELKRFDDALASYDRALALKPNNAEAYYNRGNTLRELTRLDDALASYERALAIKPDYIEAMSNRGMVLRDLKRFDDALSNYQHILAIKPESAEAEHGCGVILQDLKRYNEAIVHYGHALAIKPDLAFIFGTRLYLKRNVCDWQDLDNDLAQLIKKIDAGEQAAIPFSVLAMTACVAVQKKAAETYTESVHPDNFLLPPLIKHAHTKIKIAYFSSDFRHHPVAYLMAELFERHDKSQFDVIAFSLHVTNHKDDMRLRLEAAFDQFIDVSDQSDEQIVRLARELELDIAIDLTGCTDGGRTGIFAMRVAPIQVNYLGYSATMGADYMDYLLADRVLIPDEYQPYYSEKIAYLPNSYMASDSTRLISDRKFTRTELGLPAQGFVFCCFNNAYKITPRVFSIWMRLLHQIEGSVLWLSESNADASHNLQREATKLGISADRLIFAERLPLVSEHLARHRLADLFLDTLPYNAHTTSSDALWAGLPVLTCVDEAFASRVAASLLSAVGLPELITTNADDYEALAIQLATHPEQLATLKQKLADNRLTYPLFNTALFTQHIESAFLAMFDRYQADLAPDHIYVAAQTETIEVTPAPSNIDLFQQAFSLHQQGQLAQAEHGYEQLLQAQPQHIDGLHFLGVLAHQRGQAQRAADLISQALELAPTHAAAHSNLGLALHALKRYDDALASYDRALALNPNNADAHFNRGHSLRDLKRFDDAIVSYEQALALKPALDFLRGTWLYVKMNVCDWQDFSQSLQAIADGIARSEKVVVPFSLLAMTASVALQKQAAELYTQVKFPKASHLPLVKHTHSKIKLAYFSSDFRQHPVAYLAAELFERHDRSRFELIAFSFSPISQKDAMRLRLEAAFDKFMDVSEQSDEQIVQLARQLEIDIAVDLNGCTEWCRTGLFALRVAPVQVSYLGYSGTMGADYIDYMIADKVLIPEQYRAYYTEKIAYLPNSYMVNDNHRPIADRHFSRAELDLPEQGFVFCCFNNAYKITPAVFTVWMRLLHQIEGSVLWLSESHVDVIKHLQQEANARGIAPERIIFAKRLASLPEHLARHRAADLFLDTLPYNAHTTSSDALWAGLLVLTCVGESFASRVAASLLTAVGLPELITTTLDDYQALAIQLATHPEQLSALKQKLADNRLSYPLFNTALFTQHIEAAYQAMFDRYQAGQAPEHIYVSAQLETVKPHDDPTLHANKNQADEFYNRGNSCLAQQQFTQALQNYDQALALLPNYAEALSNRGIALQGLRRLEPALASYDRAIALKPNYVDALYNRGIVLRALNRFEQAIASYEQALAIDPDYEFLFGTWLYMKMTVCDWQGFDQHLEQLANAIQQGKKAAIPFFVQVISASAALQKQAAQQYVQAKYPTAFLLPPLVKHAHSKIKIGYFSSDFRNHPVAYLTAELFERHDRSRFEVIAFSFSLANQKDETRLRLESGFDRFIDVTQQSDEQIVRLARQLEIDIAVDLNGFTEGCRVGIFAMRVAPIQVSYIGFLGTMGAEYMDYLLADSTLIPRDQQAYYSEKIAYLPHSFQANDSKLAIANKSFTRAELRLPEQGFVFCCFNNNYKITPSVFASWMRILHQVDGSVLWLLADNTTAVNNLRQAAIAQGIAAERLIFADRLPMAAYLARHRCADLFLDTSPYNAGATASAALWAGLPILTCLGETFAGRMAASLLYAVGLSELVTHSTSEYEALAVKLATHPEQLNTLKHSLADNRLTCPLFDTALFTQHLESVFQAMFDRYQAGLAPEHIYVSADNNPIVIDSTAVDALINQGNDLEDLNRFDDALACYDHALSIHPNYARAHSNRGNVLQSLNRFDEAIASYNRALAIRPDYPEAYYNRGNALQSGQRFQEALDSYDRALAIKPDFLPALVSRGNTLHDCKRLTDALLSYDQALAIQPNYAEVLYNRGNVLYDLKCYHDAIASYKAALAIQPNYAGARWNSSFCYLMLGDFASGWQEYEWRWQTDDFKTQVRHFPQPQWFGEQSLQDKTILLYCEQGLGDSLHFCRYTKQLADLGARVILEVPKALLALLAQLEGVHQLVAQGSVLPAFDFHSPLLSLPLAFKTRLESIPVNSPYLFSDPDKVKHWQAVLGEKTLRRVGVVWSGNSAHKNNHNRSLALHDVLPLLTPHYQFISLQKELGDMDKALLAQQLMLQHYGDQISDFTDTSALCDLMDIVISVDTSVAHLAAAMGKPTWIVLPYNPDWRWLIDREDSPWYPSARLFRQTQRGDWQGVIERVRHELTYLPLSNQVGRVSDSVTRQTENNAVIDDLINQGNDLEDIGQLEAALAHYDKALAINPNHARARSNRGNVLQSLGRFDEAFASYDRALAIKPDYAEAFYNRGNALQALKRFDEALISYERALAIKPEFVLALIGRGAVLQDLQRFDDALASYDHALAIAPDYPQAHYNRGNVLQELKRLDDALLSYGRALAINPDYSEALANRGAVLQELKCFAEALADYDRVLALSPKHIDVLTRRGMVLQVLNRLDEALSNCEHALAIQPDREFMVGSWLSLKMKLCDWRDFDINLDKLSEKITRGEKAFTPFFVHSITASLALQKKVAEIYVQAKCPSDFLAPALTKHRHAKIKLAYFSSDFRNHPVAYLTAELFERHDRSRFEVLGFSFSSNTHKAETRLRLEAAFDQFIDVSQQSDKQVVRLARELEIDIAIDLNGFTEGCRPKLFAMRVAPIQVSYLGYLGTMGADYIDYLLADKTLIPVEHQAHYAEKIAYLPHSFQVNDSKMVIADKTFSRAELGLPNKGFVFCCFNNNYKITPTVFASWMRILQQVDGSVLWLLEDNAAAAKNLRHEAITQGIAAERLIFAQRLPMPDYLARHRAADLFLDTTPYNAGATASAALWSGLPILTCLGETFAGRMASSLLYAVGLPELVTQTPAEYEALAIKLATHPKQLAVLKQKLADNRLTYPLFNTTLFTQHIESAFQSMIERYQAGLAPDHIYVTAQDALTNKTTKSKSLLGKLSEKPAQLFAAISIFGKAKTKAPLPNDVDSLAQAQQLHQQGQLAAAEMLYQEVLKTQPEHAEALRCLAAIKKQRQLVSPSPAPVLANESNDIEVLRLINRGNVLEDLGRLDDALASYDRALAIQADHARAHSNRGNVLQSLQRFDEALASYDRALAINPSYAEAFYNRGNTLQACQRLQEAIASYDRALAIKPDFIQALISRGNVLHDCKHVAEALKSYEQVLAIQPDHAEALYNCGNVLLDSQRFNEALARYEQALVIKPDYAEALVGCGVALQELKRFNDALISYERAIALKPDLEFTFGDWLYMKLNLCDWRNLDTYLKQFANNVERGEKTVSPFPALALSASLALQQKVAEIYQAANYSNALALPITTKPKHTKIKIAYFSADFRHHPVAYLTAQLFECHDRERFEIIAFSLHTTNHKDDMRLRLESAFDQFIDVSQQSDEQIVRLARELEIDIAVDLNGFTKGGRPTLFVMRVAPIQVNYLGYSGTMGADYMDYLLADRVLIPSDYQPYYAEKIAYLPHSYMVNDSQRAIADRPLTRAEFGLPEQGFVFCCFNNAYKITPTVFDIWMRLLQCVDGSVLWLSGNIDAVSHLQGEAEARGIAANRLIFAQRLPSLADHLARHRLADLFLDTLPYNAHTTSSDAIWAGLPVLTCVGEAFASRVAASLLTAIGLPELITSSHEDYEALAIQLASHPEQLAALKQRLADNRLSYPLFDTTLFTQHIETAFQIMFERYQAGLAPDYIDVPTDANASTIEVPTPSLATVEKFQQAFSLHQQGQLAAAEVLYEAILKTDPQHVDVLHFLGVLKNQQGQPQLAVELIQQSLHLYANNPNAYTNLATAFEALNRFDDALLSYHQALALTPDNSYILLGRGNLLLTLNRPTEALVDYNNILANTPHHAEALFGRANVLYSLKRLDEALLDYERSLASNPNNANVLYNQGIALTELNRIDAAINSYQQALAINPDYPQVHNNLGTLLKKQNRFVEAEANYRHAIAAKPDYVDVHCNLINLLKDQGRIADADLCLTAALIAVPDSLELRVIKLIMSLPIMPINASASALVPSQFDHALTDLSTWLASSSTHQHGLIPLPFLIAYRAGNHLQRLSRYGDLVASPSKPLAVKPLANKIRMVVVSHHFRRHSVWDVITRGLLVNLDRNRFELILYHLGNIEDQETQFAKSLADQWRDTHSMTELKDWLAILESDAPDVIFYPEIGMDPMSARLAAHRFASLQIASWGHPITTGYPYIDLYFSGELLESANADSHYRERLIRLPSTGCCTTLFKVTPEPLSPELTAQLTTHSGTRFIIAQTIYKFDPADDGLYATIANAVTDSVFILLRDRDHAWVMDQIVARLEQTFIDRGLNPKQQLVVIPWQSIEKFQTLLDVCDVYLDCPSFSGYTTAWQAIHRGLPIVTLEGEFMRQRLAAGLLRKIGITDTIANSHEHYVQLAINLAKECRDPVQSAARRQALKTAAPKADNDVSVVRAFEHSVLEALAERKGELKIN